MTISRTLINLPITIRFQIEDDANPEVLEEFVLEVTNVQLTEFSTGTHLQVFVFNSVTVAISDNDGKYVHWLLLVPTCFLF